MRSANPALNNNTFKNTGRFSGTQAMTIDGTVNKTALGLLLLMTSAIYSWNSPGEALGWFVPITIFTFILLIITIFNKKAAPYTVPLYCLAEGVVLGGISKFADNMFSGIASQAMGITFGILAALLILYKSKLIAVTDNFRLGVVSATFGVFIIYILSLIFPLFGKNFMAPFFENDIWGIGFSLFVIGIASMNLVLDFDFIEKGVENGAPKYMEWYGAFGLMITLIWLYVEILNLLMKLRSRR
tara:strand:- start:228 stop:956 length:729 start_codon:yes stop_codon:yes gene_type:complete